MKSRLQIVLATAALAMFAVALSASLYGDEGAPLAATPAAANPIVDGGPTAPPSNGPESPAQLYPSEVPRPSKQSLVKDKKPPVQVKVFQLKYADANSLASLLLTALQHGKEPISIAADQRTNQIVATGGAEDLAVAEGLISQLDVEAPERPQARRDFVSGSSSTSSSSQNTPVAGANTPSGITIGSGFGGGGARGGGGFGAFGAAGGGRAFSGGGGFGGQVGSGGGGSSGWAIAVPNFEAWEKQLHEADEAAKKADDVAKRYADLLKHHEAAANASDESGQMYKQFRELVEEQRRMAEDQRRAAETARRQVEAAQRNIEAGGKQNWARIAQPDLPAIKFQYEAMMQETTRLKKLIDDLKKEGKSDEASEAAQLLTGIQERVSELGKLSTLVEQQAAAKKPVDKFDQQIRELLGAYQKSATTEKPNEEQQKNLAGLKKQLRELLNSQLQERQKSETNELIKLRDRLEKLQKEIDERLQNREGVINQRLEQLLSATTQDAEWPAKHEVIIFDKPKPSAAPAPVKLKSSFVPALPKAVTIPAVPAIPQVEPVKPESAEQPVAPAVAPPVPVEREPLK